MAAAAIRSLSPPRQAFPGAEHLSRMACPADGEITPMVLPTEGARYGPGHYREFRAHHAQTMAGTMAPRPIHVRTLETRDQTYRPPAAATWGRIHGATRLRAPIAHLHTTILL